MTQRERQPNLRVIQPKPFDSSPPTPERAAGQKAFIDSMRTRLRRGELASPAARRFRRMRGRRRRLHAFQSTMLVFAAIGTGAAVWNLRMHVVDVYAELNEVTRANAELQRRLAEVEGTLTRPSDRGPVSRRGQAEPLPEVVSLAPSAAATDLRSHWEYVVRPDDSVWSVARRSYKLHGAVLARAVRYILDLNEIDNEHRLMPGETLRMPHPRQLRRVMQ